MKQLLTTKADTLKVLYETWDSKVILPQLSFTVKKWREERNRIISDFNHLPWNEKVIVRSSSLQEDTLQTSNAGAFDSVANVSGEAAFIKAVEQVIASYADTAEENQVLVQPMLENVEMCGVVFTKDPNTLGNYYVVNYTSTGSTSDVTSGIGKGTLYYIYKKKAKENAPACLRELCVLLKSLEELLEDDRLDVEFAVSKGKTYILQVRHLCAGEGEVSTDRQEKILELIRNRIGRDQHKIPFLCGKKAVYSVMTDWNPAEMIGIHPKPLALSTYKELITDGVWAYQRDNYGYRNLRSFPLMIDFFGVPYIDVRVSFNSFVPAQLREELSEKLVNYYLDRLTEHPELHDKAEFEIVFSCYTLDLRERISVLKDYGFTDAEVEEILDSIRNVTNIIIDHEKGLWRKDFDKLSRLEKRYSEIVNSSLSLQEKIYWLLEDCKRYGTLPFAGLARAGFIAVQILQSMVSTGIITQSDYELFMGGVNSVSSQMKNDFAGYSRKKFLDKYGHLRPGTYDITSGRYDEAPDTYFSDANTNAQESTSKEEFRLSVSQLEKLRECLRENGLNNDVLELFDFIRRAIEGREYGKFMFTKNLSMALKLIEQYGAEAGITREDCAYLNIRDILDMYASTEDSIEVLNRSVAKGKESFAITRTIVLPPFIFKPDEVYCFNYPETIPNYITSQKAIGDVMVLDRPDKDMNIDDGIILIPSADPGYDWIFSHHIKGLITMYGGANSHMAIRAGELGIPAAVGVGEKMFREVAAAEKIELDALARTVKRIG